MILPETTTALGINREADYDALFMMPALKFAWIFHLLGQERTNTVVISIRENQGVTELSFIKERADPNLDRGSDSDSGDDEDLDGFQINANDVMDPGEEITVIMEDRIREVGIEKPLCMMCLHDYINMITLECPEASEVTMYIGTDDDVRTFMEYTVPGDEVREYIPPSANHQYHKKSGRDAVRNAVIWIEDGNGDGNRNDNGDGNGNDNGDGNGNGNGDGNGDRERENEVDAEDGDGELENKRQKLN